MTYQETLQFLFEQLPMYQRDGPVAFKKDLSNTLALCSSLGNPEKQFQSIHIAGTNGKGSVTHILASILQAAGYRVGIYVSPHYKDFRERIKINGQQITEDAVVDFVKDNKVTIERIQPSFFEITVAMAFNYFAQQKIDIAVVETGLGGRLDSTNVLSPILSVITNIGYDHMQFLGETLPEIAGEKAGIIKTKTPVVIGETHKETSQVFMDKAKAHKAPITFADSSLRTIASSKSIDGMKIELFQDSKLLFKQVSTDLLGNFQLKNITTVYSTIQILNKLGFHVDEKVFRQGMSAIKSNTSFIGRWQILNKNPLTICDSGHNEEGLKAILDELKQLKGGNLHFVYGMVNDKDIKKTLSILPKDATYYFCKPDIPRGLDVLILAKEAKDIQLTGTIHETVKKAYNAALSHAISTDIVFVGGSTFVVAEVL